MKQLNSHWNSLFKNKVAFEAVLEELQNWQTKTKTSILLPICKILLVSTGLLTEEVCFLLGSLQKGNKTAQMAL